MPLLLVLVFLLEKSRVDIYMYIHTVPLIFSEE